MPTAQDIVREARQSEDQELQIALQTQNSDALETYLKKYPATTKRGELLTQIGVLKRSEFTEWTLYEIGDQDKPQYMQLSSIQKFGNRAVVKMKILAEPPKNFYGKSLPDAAYREQLNVYDCTKLAVAMAEESIVNKSGELLSHYKWRDPQYLDIGIGTTFKPGSVGYATRNIACDENLSVPLVSKRQIAAMNFNLLSSTNDGDGEIYYGPIQSDHEVQDHKEVLFIVRFFEDHNIKAFLPAGTSIPDPPNYRTEVNRVLLKCDENKSAITKVEFWNTANELVRMGTLDPAAPLTFSEFVPFSPFATLQEIYCGKSFGGLGLRYTSENGATKVVEVFNGSPAEKAGVKANDIVTHIDDESVAELTAQQIIEKSRGPIDTKVVLTVLRKGQDNPIKLTVIREKIQIQPAQLEPSR